jgi:sec-independent protein translocase protein TatC
VNLRTMNSRDQYTDPDDFFADTRMSFGDHIEDLRKHLWRAIKGFLLALVVSFYFADTVLKFIAAPVQRELEAFYEKRVKLVADELKNKDSAREQQNQPRPLELLFPRPQIERLLKRKIDQGEVTVLEKDGVKAEYVALTPEFRPLSFEIETHQARQIVGRRPTLSTLNVQEAFVVFFKVAIVSGFVLASPWVFYQIWSFIAAGLYPHEKRYVNVFLPFSLGLFLLGVGVCEFLVIPKAVEALLWFNEWLGLEPDLRLNEWLGFAIWMPVIFGLSFQTPLVMLFLERIGLFNVETFRGKRRIVWFLMAIFAAVITPSTDAFSMLFLWVPMCLLYELGIWLILLSPRQPALEVEVPEPEDMVEV